MKLTWAQLVQYQAQLARLSGPALVQAQRKAARRAVLLLRNKSLTRAPGDARAGPSSGAFARGWAAVDTADGAEIVNDAPGAEFIENGRAPGKFPPKAPILAWVQRTMGLGGAEAERVAFLVARAIAQRGIPGRHLVDGNMTILMSYFDEEAEDALREVIEKTP